MKLLLRLPSIIFELTPFSPLLRVSDTFSRYYEKSIIKEEIEEQRSIINNNWDETKKSIKEARYRISLEMEQFARKRKKPSLNGTNGTSP